MKAWEIWTGPLFGAHPVLLISAQSRIDHKKAVVVLKGVFEPCFFKPFWLPSAPQQFR